MQEMRTRTHFTPMAGAFSQRAQSMDDDMLESSKPEVAEKFAGSKRIRCHDDSCSSVAICFLEGRFACLMHFISRCYERLEECHTSAFRGSGAEADTRFLRECCERAANLVEPSRGLDNLDRARLFDIFLWASELLAKRGALGDVKGLMPELPRR